MILVELVKELERIIEVHPEMAEATIWAQGDKDGQFRLMYVAMDRRHKPPRIRLED